MVWLALRGDRELDWLDLVLSELHIGATYDAVLRRRLWRNRPFDVVVAPIAILAGTATLLMSDRLILVTTIAMYAAVWHRGRQNFGIARFYQRMAGGPVCRMHQVLFSGAIYGPMAAAVLLFGHLAPTDYEGQSYYSFNTASGTAWGFGLLVVVWVLAYLCWTARQNNQQRRSCTAEAEPIPPVHPGERWIVVAHVVAFGSAYVLGTMQASFLFALTVHHEIQYLYFAYAMASRPSTVPSHQGSPGIARRFVIPVAAGFAVWPLVALSFAVATGWYDGFWLAPIGTGLLFSHYWLDGRIWTRRAAGR
jgi:hypothetical protein